MKYMWFILLLPVVFTKPFNFTINDDIVCKTYDACHPIDPNKLNVHLVPHSHDDVGWLKTVNGYYSGTVENIIGSTIAGLSQNSKRRFIQVETAFFKLWLSKQTQETIDIVKDLVNEGRLEIIGGAWSMNDEAASHYQSTIDQFTLGLKYLKDTLGKCARPRVGWQIDPFGHSREQASLFTQMGFDSFFTARIDYRDKARREKDKAMDTLWTSSANLGSESNILFSTLNHHYNYPGGFCWDKGCGDPILIPDEESDRYNLKERIDLFVERIKDYKDHYPTNNILITFGDDFQWTWAEKYFINIDRLIAGFKKFNPTIDGQEINMIYSTPSCYAKAVNEFVKTNNQKLEVKTDDFMPYADNSHDYWTGYYTSRASSKRFERIGNSINQVTKQLSALTGLSSDKNRALEEAMGVMQHHDAITGTEKQAVEKDYHKHLSAGISNAIEISSEALSQLLGFEENVLNLQYCPLANVSVCLETESVESVNVLLYNPIAHQVTQFIQVPVSGTDWKVKNQEGDEISFSHITKPMRSYDYVIDDIGGNLHDNILIFKADLPALSSNVFTIYKDLKVKRPQPTFKSLINLKEDAKIGFENQYIIINKDNNLVSHIKLNGAEIEVKIELLYYNAPHSGAYIFRPDENQQPAQQLTHNIITEVLNTDGDIIEVRQTFRDWAQYIIRIYKDAEFMEIDWVVGPIDVGDNIPKDIILRYSSTMASESIFYTDSNGREMMKRQRDHRADYDYTGEEPQAGNYYPVNTRMNIKNSDTQFGVIVDRSEGGASLRDGWIELMLHRGLLNDDNRGVGEHLYEIEYGTGLVVRGSHYITIAPKEGYGDFKSANAIERLVAQKVTLSPLPFYPKQNILEKSKSFINKDLPRNVHLLTLAPWNESENQLIIRLEHLFEKEEDPELSKEVTVDLTDLFTTFSIKSLEERSLDGNAQLSEITRLEWPQIEETEASNILNRKKRMLRADTDLSITLAPMQIRTFIATIERY